MIGKRFDKKRFQICKNLYCKSSVSSCPNENRCFEKSNENNYLTLVPTNENKEKCIIYEELWSKIRNFIRSINKNSDYYGEKYMKIKFNSDDKFP